jgi:hypothetical protein
MSYFIYENWVKPGHKARLHDANCSFCQNGAGIHPDAGPDHGTWHGPFGSLADAVERATATGGSVSACRHCCG